MRERSRADRRSSSSLGRRGSALGDHGSALGPRPSIGGFLRALELAGGAILALATLVAVGACASTKDMMAASVLDRAQHDLTCDTASIRTRMAGVVSRTKSERQGNVERATFAAEGCGGSEVYTVECIRGVCFAVQDVPPRDQQKKAPPFAEETR